MKESLKLSDSLLEVNLLNKNTDVLLNLKLTTLEKNLARFKIDELKPIRPRYEVKDVLVNEPPEIK